MAGNYALYLILQKNYKNITATAIPSSTFEISACGFIPAMDAKPPSCPKEDDKFGASSVGINIASAL